MDAETFQGGRHYVTVGCVATGEGTGEKHLFLQGTVILLDARVHSKISVPKI